MLAACASGPNKYTVKADADGNLNRDNGGRSLSVVVRVYQLRDAKEFQKLIFDTLASGRPESEFLGNELLTMTDLILVPGAEMTTTEPMVDNAKHIGIVAFFRKPDSHYWRYLFDAETVRKEGLSFRAQDCYLVPVGIKPVPIPGQPENARPECGAAAVVSPRQASRPAVVASSAEKASNKSAQRSDSRPGLLPDATLISTKSGAPLGGTVNIGGNTTINVGNPLAGAVSPFSPVTP
jgi:type VI secretion system protein VasD